MNSQHFGPKEKNVAATKYVGIKVSLNDYNPFLPIYFSPLQLVCSI
jgi:hypothetical protein